MNAETLADPIDLLTRLSDESDLCRNESADDIANLLDEAIAELKRLRARVLAHQQVMGAAAATLNDIHRAGGYHVVDPIHQPTVQRAITALEQAVVEVVNGLGKS